MGDPVAVGGGEDGAGGADRECRDEVCGAAASSGCQLAALFVLLNMPPWVLA